MAEQRAVDAEIESLRQEHYEKTQVFDLAQNKYYEVGAHIARQEQKIEHQSQMSFQLDRDMADVEKQIFDTQRALENDQLQLEEASAELEMRSEERRVGKECRSRWEGKY